ncbi:MAG: helix-turn-helix transcriptional regulator [Bacteroidales bacterium]
MTFGERIVSLRKKLKWSQDELAKKIGTSAPIIGRYERNEIKPSIEVAKKLADELEVTIDYLIGGSNQVFDKALLKKIEDIENLSDEGKKQVYDLIDMALGYHKTKQNFSK